MSDGCDVEQGGLANSALSCSRRCLQEITYLTSATTLNPLAAASYSAPHVPRPRKALPDHVPTGGPGVFNISLPPRTSTTDAPAGHAPAASLPSGGAFELPPQHHSAPPPPSISSGPPVVSLPSSTMPAGAEAITKYPSDAPSAYVPLKRTISQPGVPGSAGPINRDATSASATPSLLASTPLAGVQIPTSAPAPTLPPTSEDTSDEESLLPPGPVDELEVPVSSGVGPVTTMTKS